MKIKESSTFAFEPEVPSDDDVLNLFHARKYVRYTDTLVSNTCALHKVTWVFNFPLRSVFSKMGCCTKVTLLKIIMKCDCWYYTLHKIFLRSSHLRISLNLFQEIEKHEHKHFWNKR